MIALIEQILAYEEGFRSKPYLCSEGYVTVGYGTKLHKTPNLDPSDFLIRVTPDVAVGWLQCDISKIEKRLMASHVGGTDGIYDQMICCYPNRKAVVLSMAYQLGVSGLLGFHRFWAAVTMGKYEDAANEMLDSRWATQTPARAWRHATVMREGKMTDVYPRVYDQAHSHG